jgi:phosphoglycolate phosphatase-like HAD superfamily hydrolase
VKLLLFDLDGTILRATRGVVPFSDTMREIFGIEALATGVRFAGKTDPAIIAELLTHAGVAADVDAATLRRFEERLAIRFGEALAGGTTRVDPTPGVRVVLESLATRSDFALGVLTGNLEQTARLKLAAAGLADFFTIGAYGSDHALRAELPDVARARYHAATGHEIPRECCVIVGDTPLDHAAAVANGMPCVLVASGWTPFDELAGLAAATAFPDWSDAAAIERALEAL